MIQMALGFVTAHPAVTSALIGPRTMDHLHSQLAAADTTLSAEILDAIDAIVTPGVDLAAQEKNPQPSGPAAGPEGAQREVAGDDGPPRGGPCRGGPARRARPGSAGPPPGCRSWSPRGCRGRTRGDRGRGVDGSLPAARPRGPGLRAAAAARRRPAPVPPPGPAPRGLPVRRPRARSRAGPGAAPRAPVRRTVPVRVREGRVLSRAASNCSAASGSSGTGACRNAVARSSASVASTMKRLVRLEPSGLGSRRPSSAAGTLAPGGGGPQHHRVPPHSPLGLVLPRCTPQADRDRAIRRLGPPEYNPHDLRHKWTTVTLTSGVSIHEVSRRLGHRSIKVTVDQYGHLTQDGQERCRQVVETAMGPYVLTAGRATAVRGAGSVPAWRASRRSRRRPYRF